MRSRRFCEALARAKGEQWRLTPSSRGFVNLDVSVHPRRTNGRAVDSWWFSEGDILLLLRYPHPRWLKVSCFRTGHKHGRSGSTPTLPMGQAQPRSSQSTKWGSSRGFYRKPRSGVEQTHIGIWHSEAVRRRWLGMAVHVSRIYPVSARRSIRHRRSPLMCRVSVDRLFLHALNCNSVLYPTSYMMA